MTALRLPWLTVDMTRKPNIPRPEVIPATPATAETRAALLELIADLLRDNTVMKTHTMHDVTYEGRNIGEFRITVESVSGLAPLGTRRG